MRKSKLAGLRLAQMANQMGEERGKPIGWQTAVARELGIGDTVLNKVLSGERGAGSDTVETVAARMKIAHEYFYDAALEEPDYRDYLLDSPQRTVQKQKPTKGWQLFVSLGLREKYLELGLDEEQLEYVERAKFKRGSPEEAGPYISLCEALLQRPVERSAKEAIAEARARREQKGARKRDAPRD